MLGATWGAILSGKNREKSNKSKWGNNETGKGFLIPPYPFTSFKIQKHYHNKSKFKGVHSRNNLSKIKYGASVVNVVKYKSIWSFIILLVYVSLGITRSVERLKICAIAAGIKKYDSIIKRKKVIKQYF